MSDELICHFMNERFLVTKKKKNNSFGQCKAHSALLQLTTFNSHLAFAAPGKTGIHHGGSSCSDQQLFSHRNIKNWLWSQE